MAANAKRAKKWTKERGRRNSKFQKNSNRGYSKPSKSSASNAPAKFPLKLSEQRKFLLPKLLFEVNSNHFSINDLYNYNTLTCSKFKPCFTKKHLLSLRLLAANSLCLHLQNISELHISAFPKWANLWHIVWKKALESSVDSFKTFVAFASVFSLENGFECHSVNCIVRKKVFSQLITGISHRLETFGYNILVDNLLNDVFRISFSHYTLLNLSSLPRETASYERILRLTSYESLIGLDISNIEGSVVNETLCNSLRMSFQHGKLQNLMILRVQKSNINDITFLERLIEHSNLIYIESDFELGPYIDAQISLVKVGAQFREFPMSKKLEVLLTKFQKAYNWARKAYKQLFVEKTAVLMDYQVVPVTYKDKIDLDQVWNFRLRKPSFGIGYVIKRKQNPVCST